VVARAAGGRRALTGRALLAVAALAAGCASPFAAGRMRAAREAVAAERSLPAPSSFGTDAPGVLHYHTRLSHDSPGPLEEVVAAARATGLRWVALTEHSTPAVGTDLPRGEVDGVLLIPGEEISRAGGSILGLGTSGHVEARGRPVRALVEEVRARGGVAYLGHLASFDEEPARAPDGIAVYDLSGDVRAAGIFRLPVLARAFGSGEPGRAEDAFLLYVLRRPEATLAAWDRYLAAGPCAGAAETNSHAKFRFLGKTLDPYAALFPLVRNHALVEGPGEEETLAAIRRGRLLLGFDAAADATGARFEAFDGLRPAAAMGDALPWRRSLSLAVHLPVPARVRVLRDGRPFAGGRGRALFFPVPGPGVYRAEADLDLAGRTLPWVIANPIRVLPAGSPGEGDAR